MKKVAKKKLSQTEKKILDSKEFSANEVQRYIGVVTEEFRGQVSAVAEQFLGLNEKIDRIDQKVDSLDQKVGSLDQKVNSLDQKVGSLDQKVNSLDYKVDSLDHKVSRLEDLSNTHTEMIGRLMTDVEEIKIGMQDKVSRQDFNKLETRLVALETIVFTEHGKKKTKVQK